MLVAPVFRRILDAEGVKLGDLSPRRGVSLMIRFFQEASFTDCLPERGGDRLLYWHGVERGALTASVARQLSTPNHHVRLELKWSLAFDGPLETTSRWSGPDFEEWSRNVDTDLATLETTITGARPSVSLRLQRT